MKKITFLVILVVSLGFARTSIGAPGDLIRTFENPPHHSGKIVKNIFSPQASIPDSEHIANNFDTKIKQQDKLAESIKDSSEIADSELSSFKVFGMYEAKNDKAVFIERGKDILALREGDMIDGKFLVLKISSQRITLKPKLVDKPFFIDMNGLENN